jgi:uncharacterized membrane protein
MSIEIDASVANVWRLVSEFKSWPEWGPSIRSVQSEANSIAVGVRGHVTTLVGVRLPFEIVTVDPQRFWDWKVAGVPATGHLLFDLGEGRTRVEFTVPVVLAPYAIVLRVGLRRLKTLAESTA